MITCDESKYISRSVTPYSLAHVTDSRVETFFDVMSAKERLANLKETPGAPEQALARGVLRQATADLRRFRNAKDAIGREMYSDARSWFVSHDREWPYSFINACRALGLSPEVVLAEVFADEKASWYSHSRRLAGRVATSVKSSLSNALGAHRSQSLALAKS